MDDLKPGSSCRLFVALLVPGTVKRAMTEMQEEFQQALGRDCVRWTPPGQFHLTLRFLGDVRSEQVEDLKSSLHKVCQGRATFVLRARGFGFFPEQGFPRVLWVGVESEQDQLGDLHREVEAATDVFTNERKEKSFSGHLTLGRSKSLRPRDIGLLRRIEGGRQDRILGEWTTSAVELIRSELAKGGATHSLLCKFDFGKTK
jgi:2'-5' RNA ligase